MAHRVVADQLACNLGPGGLIQQQKARHHLCQAQTSLPRLVDSTVQQLQSIYIHTPITYCVALHIQLFLRSILTFSSSTSFPQLHPPTYTEYEQSVAAPPCQSRKRDPNSGPVLAQLAPCCIAYTPIHHHNSTTLQHHCDLTPFLITQELRVRHRSHHPDYSQITLCLTRSGKRLCVIPLGSRLMGPISC